MIWSFRWLLLWILIFLFLKFNEASPFITMQRNNLPKIIPAVSHTALSGDLAVLILDLSRLQQHQKTKSLDGDMAETTSGSTSEKPEEYNEDPFLLRVLRLDGFSSEFIGEVPIVNFSSSFNISLMIPCGFFSRGGTYSLLLQKKSSPVPTKSTDIDNPNEVQVTLDVRWPIPSLSLEPQHFYTYPSQPVLATVEYTDVTCSPESNIPITKYTLQLIYCGFSIVSCDPQNKSNVQVLYYEELHGFPVQKVITLRCEFFGLVGHYALRLKPSNANPSAPTSSAYIKVDWSDEFVFNVHARSIYPCDSGSGGISVLFEYPSCRLPGDRVRVYGRLRADVASLAPPSTIHYVAELKAPSGTHSLTFDCDIFTERFVEYCFVYVSQAITGAMAEVRVDCIPTFPLQEGDAGGWGPWSQWTPCSSSCVGGTRNRHRFCDTPPPRYGAKFCQGKAVETESCGGMNKFDPHGSMDLGDWECHHGKGLAVDRPEVTAEIGTKCRCGCVLNLSNEKSRKILAASTQACPGRSFWLIQGNSNSTVKLHFDQTKFPCPGQYVRARDGDSLNAQLLVDIAFDKKVPSAGTITSSQKTLLLEFFSDEITAAGESCIGGFLAHVTMTPKSYYDNETSTRSTFFDPKIISTGKWTLWLTPAHSVATMLLISMLVTSLFLALQYILKYRKYQIAEDLDSLADNSACNSSMQSLTRRARAMSTITLISEVVSLVRLSKRTSPKHLKLEENTGECDDEYGSIETQTEYYGNNEDSEATLRPTQSLENISQKTVVSSETSISSKCLSTSDTPVYNQPEIKYARPIKLRTITEPNKSPTDHISEEDCKQDNSTVTSTSLSSSLSPSSTSSNTLTLRCGKDSKERRNRERLLQRPGSDFSLTNPDTELELDYYDYNVVNASAVPGSYLGMDPAFLVWIPPLSSGESDILSNIEGTDCLQEGANSPNLTLNTEGTSLTPAQYHKLRNSGKFTSGEKDKILSDTSHCMLHDEIISEYKMRLSEGLLPIHRILEDSRVRVSEESLMCKQATEEINTDDALILNRVLTSTESISSTEMQIFNPNETKNRLIENQNSFYSPLQTSPVSVRKRLADKCVKDGSRLRKNRSASKNVPESKTENILLTPIVSRKYKDTLKQSNLEDKTINSSEGIVNIPLTDFGQTLDSPVRVHVPERSVHSRVETDYNIKEENIHSICDYIKEGEEGLKFVDEDEDEIVDNKITN